MLQSAWSWVLAHQAIVAAIAVFLISVLNAATTVWTDHPKAVKWLTFLVSILSIFRSKNAIEKPGLIAALKFPLIPETGTREASPGGPLITTMLTIILLTSTGCPSGNPGAFDPKNALNTACTYEPALNTIITVGVCDNLKEPSKSICLKVAAIAHTIAPAVLTAVGGIYDACRGATPRQVPKSLLKPATPASQPASTPAKRESK